MYFERPKLQKRSNDLCLTIRIICLDLFIQVRRMSGERERKIKKEKGRDVYMNIRKEREREMAGYKC